VWIFVYGNLCLYENTCVPMSGRYVCVYEKMRVDRCICPLQKVKTQK